MFHFLRLQLKKEYKPQIVPILTKTIIYYSWKLVRLVVKKSTINCGMFQFLGLQLKKEYEPQIAPILTKIIIYYLLKLM